MAEKIYHQPESCNRCKGESELTLKLFIESHLCEAATKCNECGFTDYWAYGFFESSSEMESNCEKY